jgi:hypothetical protein
MAAPVEARCGWHHGPVSACPPIDPELGDLLPDLIRRGVDIRVITASERIEPCKACSETHTGPQDPVAVVAHVAPSEALPDGYVYRETVCSEHLWEVVTWELHRGCRTWIEIPTASPEQVA